VQIIGAGVGGMPYALKEAGFYAGVALMIIVASCSDYSVRLLITLGQRVKKSYYEQLVQSQFGKVGYVAVSAAMGIFAYGAMVAYLIGIGDTMSIVVYHWSGIDSHASPWLKRVVLVTLAVGAVLPLALLRNMASLSKTSFISLLSVIFITFVVISRAIGGPGDARVPVTPDERALRFIDTKFFPAIGIISFAFVCHHACFIVYNTLRDNTNARWSKTVHLSIGIAWTVMVTLAMSAYLTFRGIMNGNFLTNYSYTDELVNVMRCMFAICQTLTYPLELFVTRHAVHALAYPRQKWTEKQHYVITVLLWASSLAIALNVADLGLVLELTGGVSAVFIGFVLPALLHFKINPSQIDWRIWKTAAAKRGATCKEYWRSYFIVVLGVLAMTFTVLTLGSELLMGGHGPHDAYADGSDGLSDIDAELAGHDSGNFNHGLPHKTPSPTPSVSRAPLNGSMRPSAMPSPAASSVPDGYYNPGWGDSPF
jgi:sodium-coupled neutral amino acid transporter 11